MTGADVANDAQHAVLGQRAGGPGLVFVGGKAFVVCVIVNVRRVEPRGLHIHVEHDVVKTAGRAVHAPTPA